MYIIREFQHVCARVKEIIDGDFATKEDLHTAIVGALLDHVEEYKPAVIEAVVPAAPDAPTA